jgi:hypothetical protein
MSPRAVGKPWDEHVPPNWGALVALWDASEVADVWSLTVRRVDTDGSESRWALRLSSQRRGREIPDKHPTGSVTTSFSPQNIPDGDRLEDLPARLKSMLTEARLVEVAHRNQGYPWVKAERLPREETPEG